MHRYVVGLVALFLNACQLHPLHGTGSLMSEAVATQLAHIEIITPESETGRALAAALKERLRSDGTGGAGSAESPHPYRLEIELSESDALLTGAPSLTNTTVTARYRCIEQKTGTVLFAREYAYVSQLIQDSNPLAVTLSGETLHQYIAAELAEAIAYQVQHAFLTRYPSR